MLAWTHLSELSRQLSNQSGYNPAGAWRFSVLLSGNQCFHTVAAKLWYRPGISYRKITKFLVHLQTELVKQSLCTRRHIYNKLRFLFYGHIITFYRQEVLSSGGADIHRLNSPPVLSLYFVLSVYFRTCFLCLHITRPVLSRSQTHTFTYNCMHAPLSVSLSESASASFRKCCKVCKRSEPFIRTSFF